MRLRVELSLGWREQVMDNTSCQMEMLRIAPFSRRCKPSPHLYQTKATRGLSPSGCSRVAGWLEKNGHDYQR